MPHIVISNEVFERLKTFSEKYCMSMKTVVEWFILVLIDENGEPQHVE